MTRRSFLVVMVVVAAAAIAARLVGSGVRGAAGGNRFPLTLPFGLAEGVSVTATPSPTPEPSPTPAPTPTPGWNVRLPLIVR